MKPSSETRTNQVFTDALRKIAAASPASSRAAIEAAQATKPSLHTRFVLDPSKAMRGSQR